MPKKNQRLSSKIIETLRGRIVRWEYPPHYPLCEEALSREFGVSRSPVRESLKALEVTGLIQRMPNRSYVVKQIMLSDIEEIYELRLAIEMYSIEVLTRRTELHEAVRERRDAWMQTSLEHLDCVSLAEMDQSFHLDLVGLVGNKMFVHELEKLNERLYAFRIIEFQSPNRLAKTWNGHLSILNAILAGDPEKARQCLADNVRGASTVVRDSYAQLLVNSYTHLEEGK